MANTCKVYTFYMCPGSTVISLYIFAVWHKPNKGKKRDHNMFGIICYPPTSIPYCSLILNTIILNFFSAGIIMVWYHLGCGVSNNVAPKSKSFFSISSLVEPYIWEHIWNLTSFQSDFFQLVLSFVEAVDGYIFLPPLCWFKNYRHTYTILCIFFSHYVDIQSHASLED
jgi:hypothetical protein